LIIALLGRVGWLQIVRGEELQRKAYEQQNSDREIPPRRGSILDRNGKQLAISATVDRIVVNPTEIDKSPEVREQLQKNLQSFWTSMRKQY